MASQAKYVVFCASGTDSFYHCDEDGAPVLFDTQDDALPAAKEYSGEILILRTVAKVTQRTTYRVETIK